MSQAIEFTFSAPHSVRPVRSVIVAEHEETGNSLADLTRVLILLVVAVIARSYLTGSHTSPVEGATPAMEPAATNEPAPSADLMDLSTVGF